MDLLKMKKRKEIKKEIKILYSLVIFSFLIIAFYFIFILNSEILYSKTIPMSLNVGEIAGFDVNDTILTFGTITSLSSSKRQLKLENNYSFPIHFKFNSEGNISDFLIFEKKIHLDSGENKIFAITAFNNNRTSGKYSGNFSITAKRFFFIDYFF